MENRLAGEGSAVTSAVVVVPQAARGILAEASAASCDVVAMATHARGTLRRAVLGSTTDKVLRATDRIVLLLHPSESTD
jgi:nucleotide-binding universal stress UspA family protein